ncbi:uncharacterized protein LOC124412939 isoform X2 [Diprion similis]|uniref:uncharacterized protein LOC124412939 isoform X2 n=1 Tax=Diprion similis TaxID=362088 RepID=UPI001EF8F895|nr:uncharacterized protein LOC124412939 isoform X2 [Diprion similis]
MDFLLYLCSLMVLITMQALAMSTRFGLPSSRLIPAETEGEITQENLVKKPLNLDWRTNLDDDASYLKPEVPLVPATLADATKPRKPNRPAATWWPSKVDRSDDSNEIQRKADSQSLGLDLDPKHHQDKSKTATFEEIETRNANIYNPLLNLDHYPIPTKKYTVVELENMNANHYNPYLN